MSINIIARSNGVGLDSDAALLTRALEKAGHKVTFSHCRSRSLLQSLLCREPQYDANIFLERVFPVWFSAAKKNILIPNQERFPKRHIKRLKKIDLVLCKSQHALEIFSSLGVNTQYISFTSKDLLDESVQKDDNSFFHLAGRSTLKGTDTILQLWGKHPEWPPLTLIQCAENAPQSVPENVHLITNHLSDEEIKQHMNSHAIHLCPSLSEGWGHYIVEATSCRAIVVTTDAPPMNELITSLTGVSIPYIKTEPRHLGANFYIDPDKLEQSIIQLLQIDTAQKENYGVSAREWFEKNDAHFRQRLLSVFEAISDSAQR